METREIKVVEATSAESVIRLMENHASEVMSTIYNDLGLLVEIESDEKDEFGIINRMLMLSLIDEIRGIKHDLYSNILDNYNELVMEINTFKARSKNENEESIIMKDYLEHSMKKNLIISSGVSLLFPAIIPIVLIVNLPILGADALVLNYHNNRLEKNTNIQEVFDLIQEPLYELTDKFRTDYLKSKKEFEELEEKAYAGDNIVKELMELINPERVGLELTDVNLIEEFKQKQLKKVNT